ncbi:hypothetical protein Tco_0447834, partial [Tanacetum coccineum]
KKKVPPTDKSKKPAPAKQTKLMKEKSTKPTPSTKASKGKVLKVQKGKRPDRLVDQEDEEPQPAPEPQIEDDEYNLQRGVTQSLPVVEGKWKAIATDEQAAQSLIELQQPSAQPQDDTSANVVRDTPSPADAKTGADTEKSNSEGDIEILNVDEERSENVSNTMVLEERTVKLDEGQAGSDPGKTPKSRPPPDEDQAGSNPKQGHVALAGPNPEPMHEDLCCYSNLDDAFTFGDHFLNNKPTEEEPSKANMEVEVESMVTVPIHQASSSAPPLSTPIIDLTLPKLVSPPTQELIYANFEKKNKVQDQTTQSLLSRIFTLENHDLYSKIDNYINETIKEAPEHAALYKALEASMDRENREEFVEATAKSRKISHDDQDPPLPSSKDSDKNKKKRHNSDTSASKKSQAQTSSALKTFDTREAPSSSSKQKTDPKSKQHVDDVPIPNDVHILDTEDIDATHLLRIKTRPDWLKPVLEEERSETPESDYDITILKTNTPYPSKKIQRIHACTHQRPQKDKDQYAVSRETQYAIFKIQYLNIMEDIKRGPYSKKSPTGRDLDNSTSNVLIPLDSWTSGLLVYKLPLSDESEEEDADEEETPDTSHDIPEYTSVPPPPSPKSAQIQELMAQARPSYLDVNQLTILLVTSLKPELSKLLASHNFASCLPTELKELPSKFTELSGDIKELKKHVAELKNTQRELPTKLQALPVLVSSVQKQLKTLDSLPSLLNKVTETLSRFATVVENALATTTKDVPSAGQSTASTAKGEKNTKDAETNLKDELVDLLGTNVVTHYHNKKLLFDKYCDKMLKGKKRPKITNCEVLIKKGPITLKIYREDRSKEVISNLKVSDLHLAE